MRQTTYALSLNLLYITTGLFEEEEAQEGGGEKKEVQ